jgi:hypothetical protein
MSISKETIKEANTYLLRINKLLKKAEKINKKLSHFDLEILIVKIGSHASHEL